MAWEVFAPSPQMRGAPKQDRWSGQSGQSIRTKHVLDTERFYRHLYEHKETFDPPLSWREVARLTGISPSTFTRLNRSHACDTDAFLTLCAWASLEPMHYAALESELSIRVD